MFFFSFKGTKTNQNTATSCSKQTQKIQRGAHDFRTKSSWPSSSCELMRFSDVIFTVLRLTVDKKRNKNHQRIKCTG